MKPFEIFEKYVVGLCKNAIQDTDYSVIVPPAYNTSDKIFSGRKRTIRPDIKIIDKNNTVLALVDAKFRPFEYLTELSSDLTLSAESLYRMIVYMSYYGKKDMPIQGIFIVPCNTGVRLFEQATIAFDDTMTLSLIGVSTDNMLSNSKSNEGTEESEADFSLLFRHILGV